MILTCSNIIPFSAGTVESLLKDIPALTNILTYHVVPGKVLAETVVTLNGKKVKTLNGAEVSESVGPEGVKVDNAKVVTDRKSVV